jgi:hypothetical protein
MTYVSVILFVLHIWTALPVFADSSSLGTPAPASPSVVSPSPSSPPANGLQNNLAPGTGGETMTDIIDIKPLEKVGFDNKILVYILYALGVLGLIGLLFFLIDYLLKKRKKIQDQPIMVLPPDTLALQHLDELEKAQGLEEREFYFRLTAIIRGYLEGRYGIDALEMTTEELLPRLNDIQIDMKLSSELKELMKSTDPVKFAGILTGQEKMEQDLIFARDFVEKTRVITLETTSGNGEA